MDPLGCGRKISWLPGSAVPQWPVQQTRVSRSACAGHAVTASALPGAAGGSWSLAGAEGLPALLPCWRCQGPAPAGWQQNRHVCKRHSHHSSAALGYQPQELSAAWAKHPTRQRRRASPEQQTQPGCRWQGSPLRRHRVKVVAHPP